MIDPVISLSRLKESVGPAHEPGADVARDRLRQAMAREQERQRASAAQPADARRIAFASAPMRFSGLRMAGALATALVAITMIANQFSPPASGNAAQVAARLRAQADASLTLLARTAANNARARRRHRPGGAHPVPTFILPPANTVVAPEEPAEELDDPIVEPTEPTGEPTDETDEEGAEEDGDTPATDEEGTTPDEDPDAGTDAPPPASPKPPASDSNPPAGGTSTAPAQGSAATPST